MAVSCAAGALSGLSAFIHFLSSFAANSASLGVALTVVCAAKVNGGLAVSSRIAISSGCGTIATAFCAAIVAVWQDAMTLASATGVAHLITFFIITRDLVIWYDRRCYPEGLMTFIAVLFVARGIKPDVSRILISTKNICPLRADV